MRVRFQADQFRIQLSPISHPYRRDGSLLSMPVRDGFPMNDRGDIGWPFLPMATTRRGADDSSQAEDEQPREIVGCELGRSPHASAVGEVTKWWAWPDSNRRPIPRERNIFPARHGGKAEYDRISAVCSTMLSYRPTFARARNLQVCLKTCL